MAGPVVSDPHSHVTGYITHRTARELAILKALQTARQPSAASVSTTTNANLTAAAPAEGKSASSSSSSSSSSLSVLEIVHSVYGAAIATGPVAASAAQNVLLHLHKLAAEHKIKPLLAAAGSKQSAECCAPAPAASAAAATELTVQERLAQYAASRWEALS
jgi:hypothetical protein